MNLSRRLLLRCFALGPVAALGCRITDVPLWSTKDPLDTDRVERIRNVVYFDGPHSDPTRHCLDLYLPRGQPGFPVAMLVHGGAWMLGDNRCCGLYSSVGEFLATQGIGAVLPNYRQSPMVKHPAHIADIARAFAWTKHHIGERGGDVNRIVLVGHSAGGHLVALLATDEQYLLAEGCRRSDIKGVVGVSGVYRIPHGKVDVELGGTSRAAVRLDEMAPLRNPARDRAGRPHHSGIPISVNFFATAFGDDPALRDRASPVCHVRSGLPPFLLLTASNDLPLLPDMAREMHQALRDHGCDSQLVEIDQRNHNSILFKAVEPSDPVARLLVAFINSPKGQG